MNKKLMKKIIYVLIFVFAFQLTIYSSASAKNYTEEAEILEQLNIIKSADNYDSAITRAELATMIARLFESDDKLKEYSISYSFTDVPEWAKYYINYVYRNQLFKGKTDTEFAGSQKVKPYEVATVMLRLLGYQESEGEFNWKEALMKMLDIDIISGSEYLEINEETEISRNHVYLLMERTLEAKMRCSDTYLIQSLYCNGNSISLESIGKVNKTKFKSAALDIKRLGDEVETNRNRIKDLKTIFDNNIPSVVTLKLNRIGSSIQRIGSGFFISSDGKIVTNYHVIKGQSYGVAILANKSPYYITGVYDYDKDVDEAIIQVENFKYNTCILGDSDKTFVGQRVYILGSPGGTANQITTGVINAKKFTNVDNIYSVNVPAHHGNSGGPVINAYGEVIGITSSAINLNGYICCGFVPINKVKELDTRSLTRLYNDINLASDYEEETED